jgi:hypothetical protein
MYNSIVLAIYKMIDIFQQPFTTSEILLNILFIGLIIIISLIIYWDTINVSVSKTSRCKRQMDIYNKNKGVYIIEANDKSRQPLYNITYDTKQYNTNVECSCKSGKYINYFNNIPVKNMRNNKDVKVDKICSCDKYYNTGMLSENVVYDGEPGIIRYMTTTSPDFFDNLVYAPYN